ncbi:hypothetical protein BHE74_00011855 [Ensete ventricosum]|uniref:Uncharacterized protein n=1 Tax=Ensete ventricosum TaxID=4639 RepID=A0A427A916_ENSVE|nr:hypothetical protein B296_00007055 [Ensete ventricosum]RWW79837.1 hypothetical protein BHE74_00011855 [Ensete ventricosum]
MKETTTSSSANDPRLPSAAKPYVPPTLSPQDLPIDYAGFLAVVFGVVGVTFGVMGLVTNYLGPSRAAKQR